ncbi:unnamed protein product, partial [marine sediment metagenome]
VWVFVSVSESGCFQVSLLEDFPVGGVLFLLSAHYRNPLDYNENSLEEATSSLER